MTFFAVNVLLATVWVLLVGGSLGNLLVGFLAGFVVLAVARPLTGSGRYVRAVLGLGRLLVHFHAALIVANLRMARDILRRRPNFHPAFLRIEVPDLSATQAVVLANLISLTPGSLTVDTDADGDVLYVHTLYAGDAEAARREMRRLADLIRAASGADEPRSREAPAWT